MKTLRRWAIMSSALLALAGITSADETLYNGIELPDQWPPKRERLTRQPMPVPYLENRPEVIPIDVGRQLLVDDFLIDSTTLKRTFHVAEYHPANPVLKPDKPWENKSRGWWAIPFSGGVWYDPGDKRFKMWYTGGYIASTCYAISEDGIHWKKPHVDPDVLPGTDNGRNIIPQPVKLGGEGRFPVGYASGGSNVVLLPVKLGGDRFNTATIWLDHDAKNPKERFKYFATEGVAGEGWQLAYRVSADGVHWSEPVAKQRIWGDRTTAFYNPFRKVWVLSQRIHGGSVGRCRSYLQASTARGLVESATYNNFMNIQGQSVFWTNADDLDPKHTESSKYTNPPQLYNLDATPYESLMLGLFSIWQGPSNRQCEQFKLQKRNDVLLGFSRDGFHWSRPCRKRFISCTWDEQSWRFGNVQSVGGGCLVVGDKLYFYFSGQAKPDARRYDTETHKGTGRWDADAATGLAILRRDGFASMDADEGGGFLTTHPLTFKGKYLFVNVDCPHGELKVGITNREGKVIEPFSLENCKPLSCDKTRAAITWKGGADLSALSGKSVRFQFNLNNGKLYSFWVSPDRSGASHGYVAAGGPGFTGPTDTVGQGTLPLWCAETQCSCRKYPTWTLKSQPCPANGR